MENLEDHHIIKERNEHNNSITIESSVKKRLYNDRDRIYDYNLISKLTNINKDLPKEILICIDNCKYNNETLEHTINEIIDHYANTEDENSFFTSFKFFGYIELKNKDTKYTFELYIKGLKYFENTFVEFMFNDVSKTLEISQAKLMEKSMFLGKLSHEFKNPLIVVCEAIEEVNDNINKIARNKIKKKLNFISNLCNYMIVLVKDFEVISSIDNNLKIDISNKDDVEIDEFLCSIDSIANALLIKKGTNQKVNFIIEKDRSIRKIKCDEIRLRQILINLISNSIKFTDTGFVMLKLEKFEKIVFNSHSKFKSQSELGPPNSKEQLSSNEALTILQSNKQDYLVFEDLQSSTQKYIKFSVIDTGKGISELKKETLFNDKVDKDSSEFNNIGTGFGLGIVKNLCKLIGTDIKFTSNTLNANNDNTIIANNTINQKGSIFSFDIPYFNQLTSLEEEHEQNTEEYIKTKFIDDKSKTDSNSSSSNSQNNFEILKNIKKRSGEVEYLNFDKVSQNIIEEIVLKPKKNNDDFYADNLYKNKKLIFTKSGKIIEESKTNSIKLDFYLNTDDKVDVYNSARNKEFKEIRFSFDDDLIPSKKMKTNTCFKKNLKEKKFTQSSFHTDKTEVNKNFFDIPEVFKAAVFNNNINPNVFDQEPYENPIFKKNSKFIQYKTPIRCNNSLLEKPISELENIPINYQSIYYKLKLGNIGQGLNLIKPHDRKKSSPFKLLKLDNSISILNKYYNIIIIILVPEFFDVNKKRSKKSDLFQFSKQ